MEYLGYDKEKKEFTLKVTGKEFYQIQDIVSQAIDSWNYLDKTDVGQTKEEARELLEKWRQVSKKAVAIVQGV
jgi:hypothetical protein